LAKPIVPVPPVPVEWHRPGDRPHTLGHFGVAAPPRRDL